MVEGDRDRNISIDDELFERYAGNIVRETQLRELERSDKDLLIFTYDQNPTFVDGYLLHTEKTRKFRLNEIKGERDLRKEI